MKVYVYRPNKTFPALFLIRFVVIFLSIQPRNCIN